MFPYLSHIKENLDSFIKDRREQFDLVFERIKNPDKEHFQNFLVYVNNLIDLKLDEETDQINYLHIHIPDFRENANIILEFLCIKFFLIHLNKAQQNNDSPGSYILDQIQQIDQFLNLPLNLPLDVSKHEEKEKRKYRKELRRLKKSLIDLQKLTNDKSIDEFSPKCLINVLKKDKDQLINSYSPTPYFTSVENLLQQDGHIPSYVTLNSDHDIDDLDKIEISNMDSEIIEEIEDVILFDCEGRKVHRKFNYEKLRKFNREGTNFKNLILVSFERKPFKLNRLLSHLNNINTKYYERPNNLRYNTFTILPCEVQYLLKEQLLSETKISFIGDESLIWQNFQENVHEFEDIYELISIKMRNIYSICNNNTFKDILLKDIFSPSVLRPKLISTGTKERLMDLDPEILDELKVSLEHTLDMVISFQLLGIIKEYIRDNKYQILLPSCVKEHLELMSLVRSEFEHLTNVDFATWKDLLSQKDPDFNLIILDYRDTGSSPFNIYPNIFENAVAFGKEGMAFFFTMFFKYNYDSTYFKYYYTLYAKIIRHPIRDSHFNWCSLVEELDNSQPEYRTQSYLWDLENYYSGTNERESMIITFYSGNRKSFYPSQLFIAKTEDEERLHALRAEDLFNELNDNKGLSIQPLDELYEGLNLFEATPEEEHEIDQLKKNYYLEQNELEHRLWKILLNRKAKKEGISTIYENLRIILEKSGLSMVKENYFKHFWLDIESDSLIPRSKRTFKVVCDFLGLPEVYFRVMLKKRARERLASRKSTTKMNNLIADLIDGGMFNNNSLDQGFDESFIIRHDLDEIGINEENLRTELKALVDLLSPNLKLNEVSSVNK